MGKDDERKIVRVPFRGIRLTQYLDFLDETVDEPLTKLFKGLLDHDPDKIPESLQVDWKERFDLPKTLRGIFNDPEFSKWIDGLDENASMYVACEIVDMEEDLLHLGPGRDNSNVTNIQDWLRNKK